MKASLFCFLLVAFTGVALSQEQTPIEVENSPPPPPSARLSNFGAAFSNDVIAYFMNLIVPPVAQGALTSLGENLPQDCCYATSTHERLYLKNMAIPSDSIESTVMVTDGPHVEMDINFDLTLHYKLCQKADFTCPPLYPCIGNARLGIKTRTKFDIELRAGPNGGPDVSFKHVKFHLSIDKHDLCFLLTGLLDVLMPFVDIFLDIFVPKALGPVVHELDLPHNFSIPGPLPMNFDWSLTDGTGTKLPGLSLQGIFDILLRSTNYQPAPFLPNYPLPLAVDNLEEHVSTFELTDSFINNMLFAVAHHFQDFEFDTNQNGYKVKINFASQPLVNFTSAPGNQATILTLNTHVSLTKIPLKIVINSLETLHFAILFNQEGLMYLSINPDDFVVDITSMTPPQPNATKNAIQNQVEAAFDAFIPQLNEALAAHPIALPFPSGVSSPVLSYFDGYARFQFDTRKGIEQSPIFGFTDPANVIDFSGKQGVESAVDSATPATLKLLEVLWEAMGSENPEEFLPFVLTGLPEKVLSCPNLPLFHQC